MRLGRFELISEEVYKKADENGIPRERVYARINDLDWDEEAACTVPVRERALDEWAEKAKANGIPLATFRMRCKRGMPLEQAASKPVKRTGRPKEDTVQYWIEQAAKNGIKKSTFQYRVYELRWDYEKAATRPTQRRPKPVV